MVFIDETGISTRPHRVRTWAPRGKTPVLRETFGWKSLSIIGALSAGRFLFRIHPGSIKAPQVIDFLKTLIRHTRQPLMVLWDGASIHRAKSVSDFVALSGGRIVAERLPAYAPELNPAEYVWAHLKQHGIGNLAVIPIRFRKCLTWFRFPACQGLPDSRNRSSRRPGLISKPPRPWHSCARPRLFYCLPFLV